MGNNIASGFPQVSGPFVDKDGRILQVWLQLLVSLWNRTGQSGSGPITGLEVGTGLIESRSGSVVTVAFGNIDPGNLLANISEAEAAAVGVTLTQYLDDIVSANQGAMLTRSANEWAALEAGSDGFSLTAHGPNNDLDWEQHGTLYNVSDGTNVVNGVTELLFNGAGVNDLGGGVAEIDITGGTGNGTVNEVSDGTNNLVNITELYFNNTQFSVSANANAAIADIDDIDTGGSPIAPIPAGSSITLTSAEYGATVLLNQAGGSAVVLPAATGSGGIFNFMVKVVGPHTITRAGADSMDGWIVGVNGGTGQFNAWGPATGSHVITLNGTTTGGAAIGDFLSIQDVASGIWEVYSGFVLQTGVVSTPFS